MFKMEVKLLPKTVALLCLWLALYRKKVLKSEVTLEKTFVTTFTVRIRLFCTILLLSMVKENLYRPIQL